MFEDGTVILIGATTENPYFEVNQALLSRSVIFELRPLEPEDIRILLRRAVEDEVKDLVPMELFSKQMRKAFWQIFVTATQETR